MAGRVSSPDFVGRRAELLTIASALDRAAPGETEHLLFDDAPEIQPTDREAANQRPPKT